MTPCGHRRGIVLDLIKINLIPEGACPVVRVLIKEVRL